MAKIDLKAAKSDYQQAREQERRDLADFLAEKLGEVERVKDKLCVITSPRSGKGRGNYTSGRRIEAYDLSNWKWVEVTDDSDFDCIVSLNMPDTDPRSGNSHALFDRVGLLVSYHKDGLYYETAIYTGINLPLNASANEEDKGKKKQLEAKEKEDKQKIIQLILEQYDMYSEKKKET